MAKPEKKSVTKAVQVTKIVQPKFLTLVDKGANQVAFKVVRGDKGAPQRIVRQRPTRRMAPTIAVQFPAAATEEQVHALMKEFGFSDYRVDTIEGVLVAIRADIEMPKTYGTINLKDGVKVLLAQGQTQASDADPKPNISVVEINFNKEHFQTVEAVKEWLTRNDVDFSDDLTFNPDNKAVVVRQEVEKDAEVKRLEPELGVELVIAKSADQDVPQGLIYVVNETAYGQWGWGQLDFAAMMADIEFCEVAQFANNVFYRVVDELLFYSYLPISARKELIGRATAQYAAFITDLLDALPAKVILNQERSDEREKQTMKTELQKRADIARAYLKEKGIPDADIKTDDTEVVAQADAKRTELEAADKAATDAAADAAKPITRGEVAEMLKTNNETLRGEITTSVAETVRASLKDIFAPADTTQRSEADTRKQEKTAEAVELGKAMGEAIRASMEPVVTTVKEQGEALKAVAATVEKLASQTTVRSDGADGKQKKVEKGDVFRGIFGGAATDKATA